MQRIIKGDQVVDENWHLLPREATLDGLSNSDDIIVPMSLWLDHAHALKVRDGGLGIWLESHEEIEAVTDDLAHFKVVALNFPVFSDGRHYSTARLLRDRYGYEGEIRAIGDVLRDQLFFMKRCGFDAFALREDRDAIEALESLRDFSETYQAATDQPLPLFRRRQA